MSTKEFDFIRCWKEIVVPLTEKFEPHQKQTLNDLSYQLDEARQEQDLSISLKHVLPKTLEELKSWSTDELVSIAKICNNYGHWHPSKTHSKVAWYHSTGTHWKIEKILITLAIERPNYSEVVHQNKIGWDKLIENYMVYPKKSKEREFEKLLPQSEFIKFEEFKSVNFKPHPFMIGPKHFPKNGGMYIKPRQAPCCMPDCGLDYDQHTSEQIVMMKLLQDITNKDIQPILLSIKDWLEKNKFSGVGFNENGFKITNA
jgi:hypothetical protein